MVPVVQSEMVIVDATAMAVAPGSVVGDWAAIDPWSIVGVGLAGCVLLLVGGRLLKPALVLAAASIGAIIGLQIAGAARDESLPDLVKALGVPPVIWVVALPLALGLGAAVLARAALALLLGASLGTAILLLGLVMATGGRPLDAPVTTDSATRTSADASTNGPARDDSGDLAGRLEGAATDAVLQRLQDEFAGDGVIPDLEEVRSWMPDGLGRWWREATAGVEPGMIDLLVAFATVSGICAFMLALLLPDRTAMVATSIGGGWLVSGASMAGWVRLFPEASPPTPFMTLLAWVVLAALGVLYQGRRNRRVRRAERD